MTRYAIMFPDVHENVLIYEFGEFDSEEAADEEAADIMGYAYDLFEECDKHMYQVAPIQLLKRSVDTIRDDLIALNTKYHP